MKRFILIFTSIVVLGACGGGSGSSGDNDSVTVDSIPDPSYNPRVETDSGARQMNLDSTQLQTR